MLESVDVGEVPHWFILDLSAAFDTVDHEILCRRLQTTFEMSGPVIDEFQSYLQGRTQHVRRGPSINLQPS